MTQCHCALALALFFAIGTARGQVLSGTLSGTVVDATDALVPGAAVTVTDLGTGRDYKQTTDNAGSFSLTNLPNGFFKVHVEHPGFASAEVSQVQVFVSRTSEVHVKMEVATTGTQVVVEATQSAVQTESVELKNSVDREQIMDMPLPTRNPLDLVKTFSGILTPNVTNGQTGGDAFVHGLRGAATNLTQDGINVQDNTVKTSAFFAISTPIVDTIGEINVSVGGVGADAGFGAAQVSMVTQRGTNDFHGSIFWYQRTDFLNANTWFNNINGVARPFQLQNQIGASAGGPVVIPKLYHGKNKTWIFGAYEAYREPRSQPRVRTVMTPSAEQGLFTYTPTTGGAPLTVNLLNVGTIGNSSVKPQINAGIMNFYDKVVPSTGLTDSGCSGDGVNIRCLALNLAGVNNVDYYTLRVDHQLTQKHSIEFVWNQANYNTAPDFLNSNEPQFLNSPYAGGQVSTRQVFVWALQSVFTPTMTNDFRVGYQRAPVQFAYGYGFGDEGGNQVNFAQSSPITNPVLVSTNFPQGRNTPVRQVVDNFAWVHGNHQVRFGGEFRIDVEGAFNSGLVIPEVTLGNNSANPDGLSTSTLPGISSAALLKAQEVFDNVTGLLSNLQQAFNHTSPTSGYVPGAQINYTPVIHNLAFHGEDTWKLRRNLTVQYGVRWEYQGTYNVRNGLIILPQNNLQSLWGPSPVGSYFQPGNVNGATDSFLTLQGASNGKQVYAAPLDNFAPFLGLAYSPGSDGKTSIRASFATHYIQDGLTFYNQAATGNAGLFTTAANNVPTGVYNTTGSNPLPAAPVSVFPGSMATNFKNNTSQNVFNFDPNLRTPYVAEWSIGVQRELVKKISIEARYVGNHAVKLYRAWSINELDVNNNGVLQAFDAAQTNLAINTANGKSGTFAFNGLPGQIATPLFDKIFAGLPAASGYGNSAFITDLQQNQIGAMFNTGSTNIRRSATYASNIAANFPLNYFVANPWAYNAYQINNASWSKFDGLEVEVNRRFSRTGFVLAANYTFSKALADEIAASNQTELQNYQSVANTALDKFRAGFDVRHSFGMSVLYPVPIGRGRQFGANMNRFADHILGGWNINGFTHWSTGAPLTISSNRTTSASTLLTTANIENMTASQLANNIGVYRTGNGVYFINPQSGLVKISGGTSTANICTAGETTPCFAYPNTDQIGNIPYNFLSGPHFFDQDMSLVKDTHIFEHLGFQIRLEAFDLFNTANFTAPFQTTAATSGATNSLDSSTFGQYQSTFDTARGGGVTARIVQWAIKLTF